MIVFKYKYPLNACFRNIELSFMWINRIMKCLDVFCYVWAGRYRKKDFENVFEVFCIENFRWKAFFSAAGRPYVLLCVSDHRRMILQECFFSHWKAMRLSFWDATLDAWFPSKFSATFLPPPTTTLFTNSSPFSSHFHSNSIRNWNIIIKHSSSQLLKFK